MNLITKRVHMNRCNGREVKQLTLDRDFNVPDARPDALQIMKEQGEVQIEEVHMMEGKASVKGLLHFQILYASDGDIPVSEMTGTIPFEETILLPQAKAEDEISVQAEIGDLKSELINSRKLGMKAIVVLNVTAGSVCDGEGAIDIEGGEDIYTKKRTAEVSYLIFSKKDTLRVRDEWKIPGTKDAMQRILYSDVCIGELNTRMEEEKLGETYEKIRDFLMIVLLGTLIFYYPAKVILTMLLPAYAESMRYMALMFPVCVFDCKISLLANTYLKALRKEKDILLINLFSVLISVITTIITVYVIHSLELAVVSIVVILAIKCGIAEMLLAKNMKISVYKDMLIEIVFVAAFIVTSWYLNNWIATIIYGGMYIIYLFWKKDKALGAFIGEELQKKSDI